MIILAFAAALPAMKLEWFFDEPSAARAMETHMNCIASGVFERREDKRDANIVAALVVEGCVQESATLRNALADVFSRKSEFVPIGMQPVEAAAKAVTEANGWVEAAILDERNHG